MIILTPCLIFDFFVEKKKWLLLGLLFLVCFLSEKKSLLVFFFPLPAVLSCFLFFEQMLRLPFLFPIKTSLSLKKYPLPIFCFYLPSLPMLFLFFNQKFLPFFASEIENERKGKIVHHRHVSRLHWPLKKTIQLSPFFFFNRL